MPRDGATIFSDLIGDLWSEWRQDSCSSDGDHGVLGRNGLHPRIRWRMFCLLQGSGKSGAWRKQTQGHNSRYCQHRHPDRWVRYRKLLRHFPRRWWRRRWRLINDNGRISLFSQCGVRCRDLAKVLWEWAGTPMTPVELR